jgi:hypothetical protein
MVSMPTITADERRALKLIATAQSTGCTERLLTDRGFSLEFLAGLVRSNLASVAAVERVGSGHTADIVCRLRITGAGKRAVAHRA